MAEKKSKSKTGGGVALGKELKISEAQQTMMLAVIGAGVLVGAGAWFAKYFLSAIEFTGRALTAEETSLQSYSDAIKNIGVCTAPKGKTYTSAELKNCDPNNVDIADVPDTLKYNILEVMAGDENLLSVETNSTRSCLNPNSAEGENYTYEDLKAIYNATTTDEERKSALNLMLTCSALRVVPDALPSSNNQEATLASLNQIFNLSGWMPESLSPTGSGEDSDYDEDGNYIGTEGLKKIEFDFDMDSSTETVLKVMNTLQSSIRTFSIDNLTLSFSSNASQVTTDEEGGTTTTDSLQASFSATAYYTGSVDLGAEELTVTVEKPKTTTTTTVESED